MEAQQPKTVVVNGKEYVISKFMADVGLRVFLRVAKLVAEPISKVAGATEEDLKLNPGQFQERVADMIQSFAGRLDEEEVVRTVTDLLSVVIPPGQTYPLADPMNPSRGTWKVHFSGRLADMFVVLYHVVMENFEDFLFGLKAVGAKFGGLKIGAAFPGLST